MWHSNAPWVPTGYGRQTAIWTPLIKSLGHEVVISTFYGLQGAPLVWDGMVVLPASQHHHGSDILNERMAREKCDILITLHDIWVLEPQPLTKLKAAHWMPVDCAPLGMMDAACLKLSGATPIALTEFGAAQLREAGFSPLYVPHGIDTNVFKPLIHRDVLRREMGVEDKFVIGMNAANKDAVRKGMFEQLAAFAKLHEKHPDTHLLFHGLVAEQGGLDIPAMARSLGLANAIGFVDQYACMTGSITDDVMAAWYNCLDAYTAGAYGEGFCVPAAEALACGVPVVYTNASALPEVVGAAGWAVNGEPFWNPSHQAMWTKPSIPQLFRAYEQAYQRGKPYESRRAKAREQAMKYDTQRVLTEFWKPALEKLEASL